VNGGGTSKMKKLIVSAAAVALTFGAATSVSAEEYEVEKGDTLWDIANEYNVEVNSLMDNNDLDSDLIHPAQILQIDNESSDSNESDDSAESSDDNGASEEATDEQAPAPSNDDEATEEDNNESDEAVEETNESDEVAEEENSESDEATEEASDEADQATEEESNNEEETDNSDGETISAEATAYTASCDGCSGTTATGVDLNENSDEKVIAVDPDVIPLGSKVHVEGYGTATAADTGGDINGDRVDLFMADEGDANSFGRQNVEVTIVE